MEIMKLALDAGHGRYTAGKRCLKSLDSKETREWILNDRICRYLQELLQKYNVEVLRLDDTTGNVDIPLSTRTSKANTWGSDFCLSIHHNAGAKGTTAGGITLHIDPNAKSPVPAYQKKLYDILIKHTGLKGNRVSPLYTNDFSMTKHIKNQKSILIEHGFMDSKIDVPIILSEQFAKNCAKAHEEFLLTTFDLKLKGGKEMLSKGNADKELTKIWQKYLVSKGYDLGNFGPEKNGVDGDFGSATDIATKKYESDNGLVVDGVVDLNDALYALGQKDLVLQNNEGLTSIVAKLTSETAQLKNELTQKNAECEVIKSDLEKSKAKVQSIENMLDEKRAEVDRIKESWRKFSSLIK